MSIISKLLEELDKVKNGQVMDSMEDETGLNEVEPITEDYEEDDDLGLYIQTTKALYDKYIAPAEKGMGKVAWDKLIDDAVKLYKKEVEDVEFTDEQKQSAKEYIRDYFNLKEDFKPAEMKKAEYKDMKIKKPEEEKAPIKEEVAEKLSFKIGDADCTATNSTSGDITAEDVKQAIETENPPIFFNDADGYHYIMDFAFDKNGKKYWIESKNIEGDFSKMDFNIYESAPVKESVAGKLLKQCEDLKIEVEIKDDGEIEVEVKPEAQENEEKEEPTEEIEPIEELPADEQAPIEESRADKIRKGVHKRVVRENAETKISYNGKDYNVSDEAFDIVRQELLKVMRKDETILVSELQKLVESKGIKLSEEELAAVADVCLRYTRIKDGKDGKVIYFGNAKSESLNEDKYTEVESLIEEIFGKVGTEPGDFRLYSNIATAFVAKNRQSGGITGAIVSGKNLKELTLKLEAIKDYIAYQNHPEYFNEAVEGLGELSNWERCTDCLPRTERNLTIDIPVKYEGIDHAVVAYIYKNIDNAEKPFGYEIVFEDIGGNRKDFVIGDCESATNAIEDCVDGILNLDKKYELDIVYDVKPLAPSDTDEQFLKGEINEVKEEDVEEVKIQRQLNALNAEAKANQTGDVEDVKKADELADKADKNIKLTKKWRKAKGLEESKANKKSSKKSLTESTVVVSYDNGKHEIVKCDKGYFNKYNITEGKARFTTKCVKTLPTAIGALKKRFPEAEEDKR